MANRGRPKVLLTDYQEKFINDNFYKMTYAEMVGELKFNSSSCIRVYCRKVGLTKNNKSLSEEDKSFIRGHISMPLQEIATELKISCSTIKDFIVNEMEENTPFIPRAEKRAKVISPFFNVDARENWAI